MAIINDEDQEVSQIYTEPPEHNVLTDEDSGDEDGGLFDNLSGRQLRAGVEVVVRSQEEPPEEETMVPGQDSSPFKKKSNTKK